MLQIIWKCHTNRTTDSMDEFQRAEMLMYFHKENEKENSYLCRHLHMFQTQKTCTKNTCAISNHLSCLQRALLYCASSLENINLHSTGQHTDPLTAPFPRRVPQFSSQMALVPPHLLYMEVLRCSCQGNGHTSAQPNAPEESGVLTYFWQQESLRSFQSLLLVTKFTYTCIYQLLQET